MHFLSTRYNYQFYICYVELGKNTDFLLLNAQKISTELDILFLQTVLHSMYRMYDLLRLLVVYVRRELFIQCAFVSGDN